MAIRFRATLHFSAGSGMAQWCTDQMAVRMGMAFHLKAGTPEQELSFSGADGETFKCDVFWPEDREDLATDTIATLQAVTAWLKPDDPDPLSEVQSTMDWHYCTHDNTSDLPCTLEWQWTNS